MFPYYGTKCPFWAIVASVKDWGRIQAITESITKGHFILKQIFTDNWERFMGLFKKICG